MDSTEESKEKKSQTSENPVKVEFKVSKQCTSQRRDTLILTKPSNRDWDGGSQMRGKEIAVSRISVSAEDRHAFHIMHNLNHRNIISMKALGKFGGQFSAFIEVSDGCLYPTCWEKLYDSFNQMPSNILQMIIREVIEVIDFLRRNNTYHGNLGWHNTLRKYPYTVKASSFEEKDMEPIQAQWEDWTDIVKMLRVLSDRAQASNRKSLIRQLIYGDVDSLINEIENSNISELPSMREKILKNPFFWTKPKRFHIMMNKVPILLGNGDFRESISDSAICQLPWDSNDTNRPLEEALAQRFQPLLEKCNSYRLGLNTKTEYAVPSHSAGSQEKDKMIEKFDCDECIDLVAFAYAAYTHADELKEDVDLLFRAKFFKFFSELRLVMSAFLTL